MGTAFGGRDGEVGVGVDQRSMQARHQIFREYGPNRGAP